jgi:hypothetical protein
MNTSWFSVCAVVASISLGACSSTPQITPPSASRVIASVETLNAQTRATPITFVGKLEDSNAYLGIVQRGTTVTGFVSDGTDDGVRVSTWFSGEVHDGALRLVQRDDSSPLGQGGVNAASVTGRLTLNDGVSRAFQAVRVQHPNGLRQAVLKDASGVAQGLAVWVALPDGTRRGAVMALDGNGAAQLLKADYDQTLGLASTTAEVDIVNSMAPGSFCSSLLAFITSTLDRYLETVKVWPYGNYSESPLSLEESLEYGLYRWNNIAGRDEEVPCRVLTGISAAGG